MTESSISPVYLHRDRFDPASDLVRLSKESPVSKIDLPAPGPWNAASAWLVMGYQEVRSVLRDSRSFSSSPRLEVMQAAAAPNIFSSAGNLLVLEAPEHARLRRLLNQEFATRSLQGLIPAIQRIVREHLDGMEDMGAPVDLVESFSYPVSILVLCEFAGIPHEERMEFVRRNYSRAHEMYISMEEQIGVYFDSREYVKGIVARQRADPGDNLLGRLIRRHGRELADEELAALCVVLVSGAESASNMITAGTAVLLRDPEQLALLRDHPEMTAKAVEELLRYITVFQSLDPRRATRDVVLAGQQIKAGELVLISLLMANRDEALGSGMDHLDVTRAYRPHLAFGHGVHRCLGAPLARLEMQVAFREMLARFPGLRLSTPTEDLEFTDNSVVFGVKALMLSW